MGRLTPTLHQGQTRDRTANEQTPTHNKPKQRGIRPTETMVVLHHPVELRSDSKDYETTAPHNSSPQPNTNISTPCEL